MYAASRPDVLVIGAGLAGLSCAAALADQGLRVVVLESSDVAGGRARSWTDPAMGETVDIGPHVVLSRYDNFLALLDRLGTRGHIVWQRGRLLTLDDGGRRRPIRTWPLPAPLHFVRALPQMLSAMPLGAALSNLRVGWQAMRRDESALLELDSTPGRAYLRAHGVDERFIEWFWASAAMALLNVPVERCSAAALMRVAGQMLGHDDARFGFPAVGLGELYIPGCTVAIERAGGELLLSAQARSLIWDEGRAVGAVLADGRSVRAGACVLAVPPAAASALLPGDPVGRRAGRFEPSPYVSCYLWFDRPLDTEPFWARPWSSSALNTDFYDLSRIRGRPGAGALIASNIIWSHRVQDWRDEDIVAATVAEIARFAPQARQARLVGSAVHRIPMSVPCPYAGTEVLRPDAGAVAGLAMAGDWTRTGLPASMESAVRSGLLAAERVLADRGVARRLARPVPAVRGLVAAVRRLAPGGQAPGS